MIAKLTGLLDSIGTNYVVIDVNGVGYIVYASSCTLSQIGSVKGMPVSLLIETHVREDQITLYGFADAMEKEWFLILCTVQGVGAKVAQAILGVIPAEQLPVVIASQDKSVLRQSEGVGERLAVRIITELKDKAGKMILGQAATQKVQATQGQEGKGSSVLESMSGNVSNDAVSALINLGYGRSEAFGVVAEVLRQKGDDLLLGDIIRESLKELSA